MANTRQTAEDFIGLDKLYIAKITADDEKGLTYDKPQWFAPAGQLTKSTSTDTKKTYYDNGTYRVLSSEDSDELKLVVPVLDLATQALITGKTIDPATNALIDSGEPETVYFALMARAQMSDYSYRYYCWHKVSFAVPDEDISTRGESIDPSNMELTATAIKTQYQYSIGGKTSGVKRIVVDERDGKVDVSKWYDKVPVPNSIPVIGA